MCVWYLYLQGIYIYIAFKVKNVLLSHQQISGSVEPGQQHWQQQKLKQHDTSAAAVSAYIYNHSNQSSPVIQIQKYRNTEYVALVLVRWCSLTSRSVSRAFHKPATTPDLLQYSDLLPTFSRQPPRQPGSSKSKKRAGGEAQWYIIDPP